MSELVEISKLNGSFKRNYGRFIGAYLYLRSISAARGRSFFLGQRDFDGLFGGRGLVDETRFGLDTFIEDRDLSHLTSSPTFSTNICFSKSCRLG